jgi:hypothetical protein
MQDAVCRSVVSFRMLIPLAGGRKEREARQAIPIHRQGLRHGARRSIPRSWRK